MAIHAAGKSPFRPVSAIRANYALKKNSVIPDISGMTEPVSFQTNGKIFRHSPFA